MGNPLFFQSSNMLMCSHPNCQKYSPPLTSIYGCASFPAASKVSDMVVDNGTYSNPTFLIACTRDEQ